MDSHSKISIVGKTNLGRVRTNNEDAFVAQTLWDKNTYLAVAIDGVGGYEGGEIAAEIARKTIPEFLLASANGERVELLKQAVTAANNAIFEAREADPKHGQMSCVLTAAIIDVAQGQISMAHVGDSRLYSFHHGELKKLSHDHSLIGYREEIGDLSEEEAMHHPQRNVIGRDVGSQKHKVNDDDFIEAQVFSLLPNTTLLFCSDGLTDMITSSEIISVLRTQKKLEKKAEALINAALDAGGKDNVTVVLFEYQNDEPEVIPVENDNEVELGRLKEEGPACMDKQQKISRSFRKLWTIVFICLLVGLLVGAALFWGITSQMKKNNKAYEEQFDTYNNRIDSLQGMIEQLNGHINNQEQDTLGTVEMDLSHE